MDSITKHYVYITQAKPPTCRSTGMAYERRPKMVKSVLLQVRIYPSMAAHLDDDADEQGTDRAEIVRRILDNYYTEKYRAQIEQSNLPKLSDLPENKGEQE